MHQNWSNSNSQHPHVVLNLIEESLVPSETCVAFIADGPPDPSDGSDAARSKRASFGKDPVGDCLKKFEKQFGKSTDLKSICACLAC